MLELIDNFLNKITMYRLVLYYLVLLIIAAMVLGFFGVLAYSPFTILFSTIFIIAICWITNTVFAAVFQANTNVESVYISAFILALILTPTTSLDKFPLVIFASILTMASKYIVAIKKKHIFNPVALGVLLTTLVIDQSASWWVGTFYMLPFVLIGGLLVARKLQRFNLVLSFIIVSLFFISVFGISRGINPLVILSKAVSDSPLLFFALVMLTEPLTTPPTKNLQIGYGVFVGFLFAPQIHLGSIYTTPELALVVGNIFSYIVSPKKKLIFKIQKIIQTTPDSFDFIFKTDRRFTFKPGQYLEWTLGHNKPDSRGNRRYFTITSSPTEDEIRMGVKFYEHPSSFKQSLISMQKDDIIIASQLAGDFVLPKDRNKKLVFIAGGIGITPFRSMIKYLLDTHEKRSITLFYSNKTEQDIAYRDIFSKAENELGIKVVYNLTDLSRISPSWLGKKGVINEQTIRAEAPDYQDRIFYLSGPRSMVVAFEKVLKRMGIERRHIKIDFFPGFA